MRPTVDALAQSFRVASFSLCGEPGEPALAGDFDAHLAQVDGAIEALGGAPAIVVGISFGGWVAVRFAARQPERVRALVIVSTPGPGYEPDARHAKWMESPRRSFPAFVLTSPARLMPEVRAAFPARGERVGFLARHTWRALVAPMSATRAAARVRMALGIDFAETLRHVSVPTLVITGDEGLDLVVPPASTREYAHAIAGARVARVERTGHLGSVSRPEHFAGIVERFVESLEHEHSVVA